MPRSSVFWASATLALLRHRRRFVMQTARTDCGVASALTVLNMIGRKADPVLASEALNPDCAGSSLEALRHQQQRAVELGAQVLEDRSIDPEESLVVLQDPAGHPFCILVA